jgi:hypothetical protein
MLSKFEAETIVLEMSDWFGSDLDDPVFQAAVLLLLGVGRRKHLGDLIRISKYPKVVVKSCLVNLRRSGVWRGASKVTYCNWKAEHLGFLLDAMTGAGILERAN